MRNRISEGPYVNDAWKDRSEDGGCDQTHEVDKTYQSVFDGTNFKSKLDW